MGLLGKSDDTSQLQTQDWCSDDDRHNKLDPLPYVPSPPILLLATVIQPLQYNYTAEEQCLNSPDHKVGCTTTTLYVWLLVLYYDQHT